MMPEITPEFTLLAGSGSLPDTGTAVSSPNRPATAASAPTDQSDRTIYVGTADRRQ